MRLERKLEKAIQRDGEQNQQHILAELKRRFPQYFKPEGEEIKKKAIVKKRRIAVFSSLATVVACLAIILPCALLLPNRQQGGNGDKTFYCTVDQYEKTESDYTLKEYSQKNKGNILYFDWYDDSEDLSTYNYVLISNKDVLCVKESAYRPEYDELVTISVTKSNVYLSEWDSVIEACKQETTIRGLKIKSVVNNDGSYCIFENNGYRYFIQTEAGQGENRLFALVEELLQKQ